MADIPRKHRLERLLQQMRPHPSPRIGLEQYTIPASTAADILFLAAVVYRDIIDKDVLDLGTGTGRLAIGAAVLGAHRVTALDIDPTAIAVARTNSESAKVNVEWVVGDLDAIHGSFDTVLMNPPFGTKKRHTDKIFLKKAIALGRVVYSIHKSATRRHIVGYLEKSGCTVHAIHEYLLDIPRMFEHHRKRRHSVKVDCYRIEAKESHDSSV
jgi:putative methylase